MKLRLKRLRTGFYSRISFRVPPAAVPYLTKLFTRGLKHADMFDVEISLPSKKRSTGPYSQNRHFNGHCQQIAIQTGGDFDSVKLGLKFRACDMGYPCVHNKMGDRIPKSESQATTTECALLIEAAHIVAAELGIELMEG